MHVPQQGGGGSGISLLTLKLTQKEKHQMCLFDWLLFATSSLSHHCSTLVSMINCEYLFFFGGSILFFIENLSYFTLARLNNCSTKIKLVLKVQYTSLFLISNTFCM